MTLVSAVLACNCMFSTMCASEYAAVKNLIKVLNLKRANSQVNFFAKLSIEVMYTTKLFAFCFAEVYCCIDTPISSKQNVLTNHQLSSLLLSLKLAPS